MFNGLILKLHICSKHLKIILNNIKVSSIDVRILGNKSHKIYNYIDAMNYNQN
jgi:hypothetical protein